LVNARHSSAAFALIEFIGGPSFTPKRHSQGPLGTKPAAARVRPLSTFNRRLSTVYPDHHSQGVNLRKFRVHRTTHHPLHSCLHLLQFRRIFVFLEEHG
jgi:hypothetical protein